MVRLLSTLAKMSIRAVDGDIGHVRDFYFDDERWVIRYVVVDTGSWLFGKSVLVPPIAATDVDWEAKRISVNLTKAQLRDSPDIDTARPISRQQEARYLKYFQWPVYWGEAFAYAGALQVADSEGEGAEPEATSHLRSVDEVRGYDVRAVGDEPFTESHPEAHGGEPLGKVTDFVITRRRWRIHKIVIEARKRLPGERIMVAPFWIERVSWRDAQVFVDLREQAILEAPIIDPHSVVTGVFRVAEKHLKG